MYSSLSRHSKTKCWFLKQNETKKTVARAISTTNVEEKEGDEMDEKKSSESEDDYEGIVFDLIVLVLH